MWLCAMLAAVAALCGPCVRRHAACDDPCASCGGREGTSGQGCTTPASPNATPNCRSTTTFLPLPVTGPRPTPLICAAAPRLRELYNTGPDATLQYSSSHCPVLLPTPQYAGSRRGQVACARGRWSPCSTSATETTRLEFKTAEFAIANLAISSSSPNGDATELALPPSLIPTTLRQSTDRTHALCTLRGDEICIL